MSAALLSGLRKLFGSEQRADCTIVFYISNEDKPDSVSGAEAKASGPTEIPSAGSDAVAAKGPAPQIVTTVDAALEDGAGAGAGAEAPVSATMAPSRVVGDPVPAHLIILTSGSAYFEAQAARWTDGPAASSGASSSGGSRPELRVPLDGADEVPHALAAVRFIYSGRLEGVNGAAGLLRVRRLAAYLQVEGCVEACDAQLLGSVSQGSPGAAPLSGVFELHSCRQLLPAPQSDPGAQALADRLFSACREQLKHCAGYADKTDTDVKFGDVMAWAFRDAPSLLNDPESKRQVCALPAAALEALLGSDSFATDDEATVLLLLAEWLQANPDTSSAVRPRLCKLVRLCQLDETYLMQVLPLMDWFPISRPERAVLCSFGAATDSKRARLAMEAGGRYDVKSAWYSGKPRPQPRSGRGKVYEWAVKQADLAAPPSKPGGSVLLYGRFGNGLASFIAKGFEWRPALRRTHEEPSASMFLYCFLPASLRVASAKQTELVAVVCPGAVRLAVHSWLEDGTRTDACSLSYDEAYVRVGRGWGLAQGLPLAAAGRAAQQGAPPDPLAPWAAYLRDGQIGGTLVCE